MVTKHKRKFSAEFKAKVCLESIKERSTTEMISKKFMLNPTQINNWKKDFINKAHIIFETNEKNDTSNTEELIQSLYEKIGKQEIALDFYKKKIVNLGKSEKMKLIDNNTLSSETFFVFL